MDELIKQYKLNQDIEVRNQMLILSMPLIEKACRSSRNRWRNYSHQDAVSIGILTFIDCLDTFDLNRNTSFEAYVYSKIQFRLIDQIRSEGFVPRRVYEFAKEVNKAVEELSNQLMRFPSDTEVAEYLKTDVRTLSNHYQEMASGSFLSFEEINENFGDRDLRDPMASPAELFIQKVEKQNLAKAIRHLSKKEQILLNLYYTEGYKLREIASVFEVSEARISQMHAQIISKLRNHLKEEMV